MVETDQDIIDSIRLNARKLAALLENSTLPEEIKEAWVTLLPMLSARQIDMFLRTLEARYLDEQTREIDTRYREKLQALVKTFEEEKRQEDAKMVEQLKKVDSLVDML